MYYLETCKKLKVKYFKTNTLTTSLNYFTEKLSLLRDIKLLREEESESRLTTFLKERYKIRMLSRKYERKSKNIH